MSCLVQSTNTCVSCLVQSTTTSCRSVTLPLLAETLLLVDSTGSENSLTDTDSDSDTASNELDEHANLTSHAGAQTKKTGFSQRIALEVCSQF